MSDPTDETSAPDDAHRELANPTLTAEAPAPDAGMAASGRDWPRVLGKVRLLRDRAVPVHPGDPADEGGRQGDRALARGQPAFLERDLDARRRLARRVHRPVAARRSARRRAQPVRRGRPHRAPDVHDALRSRGWARRSSCCWSGSCTRCRNRGPQPRRVDRHGRARALRSPRSSTSPGCCSGYAHPEVRQRSTGSI